ncbi:MAG: hypothetical protein JNK74_24415 [Candidatus Hydrogenedentes bacterium]|nr:hypothetical protein [Candidatus Hydrogenedentota bacterium]
MPKSALSQNIRTPRPAYIDGGMAAMLLQGAIGGILAATLYFTGFVRAMKNWFSGEPAKKTPSDPSKEDTGV